MEYSGKRNRNHDVGCFDLETNVKLFYGKYVALNRAIRIIAESCSYHRVRSFRFEALVETRIEEPTNRGCQQQR